MYRRGFVRSVGTGAALALCPRLSHGAAPAFGQAKRGDLPPNLIFTLTDDLGFDLLSP